MPTYCSIRDLPLYELDVPDLREQSVAFPYTLFTLVQHNINLIYDSVPSRVFENGLDLDAWYPLLRRLPSTASFCFTHRRTRERARRTLDTVRDRFDVRCGPLDQVG